MISGSEYNKIVHQKNEIYSRLIKQCSKLLTSPEAEEVSKYLDTRVSKYNQKKFQFGYFPNESQIEILLQDKIVSWEDLSKLGLSYGDNRLLLSYHNLLMPVKDGYGNIVGVIGRTVYPENKMKELGIEKYKYSNFKKNSYLFGLDLAKKAIVANNSAIIVEGQIDCISCHAHGFHNTVALGGSNLNFFHLFLIRNLCNKMYLILDNDQAGIKAKEKIIKKYSKYIKIIPIDIPTPFKDIDNYLSKSKNYKALDIILTGE